MLDSVKIEKKNCKMIAHRGLSGLERENSCAAFVAAGVRSYYGIETDVHLTADGNYVICHDDDVNRVAGVDLCLEKSTLDQLKAVRLFDTDGKSRRSDLCLPLLTDYIAICRKYEKQAILELKNFIPAKNIAEIAAIIKDMGWPEHTTFISFNRENLQALREMEGGEEVSVQFLTGEATDDTFEFMKKYHFDADLWEGCVSKEFVARLHAEGLKVNCWTIDTPEAAAAMLDAGVDFITTDILE